MPIEVAYQGRRKPFAGSGYDSSKLASYAPANLGFFFTSSNKTARSFGTSLDRADIDTSNLTLIDGESKNLREFIDRISKIKRIGRRDGVKIEGVIDGVYHDILYIIWNSKAISGRKEISSKSGDVNEEDMSTAAIQGFDAPLRSRKSVKSKKTINKRIMQTKSFKSISDSALRVMLGEAVSTPPDIDVAGLTADVEAPAAPAAAPNSTAEVPDEAPEKTKAPKKSADKPKFVAVCKKDGEEATLLLSKDELEEFIHENGVKCITVLYELGKETKIPTIKVKA